jgi:hypothetical protein
VVAPQYRELFNEEKGYKGMPFKQIRSMVGENIMGVFFEALKADTDLMQAIVKGPRGDVEMDWDQFTYEEIEKIKGEATGCCFCGGSFPTVEDLMEGDNLDRIKVSGMMQKSYSHHSEGSGRHNARWCTRYARG